MNISAISDSISSFSLKPEQNKVNNTQSFEDMLNKAVSEVNTQQVEGYAAMKDISTGKVTNLQEAVQQIEEAELSLKLALEVKNKAINAYKEVMKMQI